MAEGGVGQRQHPGQRVMEVIVGGELPDILLSLLRLEHPKEHVEGHLFVGIWDWNKRYMYMHNDNSANQAGMVGSNSKQGLMQDYQLQGRGGHPCSSSLMCILLYVHFRNPMKGGKSL